MTKHRTHTLKCWPSAFEATRKGRKCFEYRSEEGRDFGVGDRLMLREWDPHSDYPNTGGAASRRYTGRTLTVKVTHLERGRFGIPDGFVVMSIKVVKDG